jgi:3-deoxy-D-manno-octulosonic-acid transferase
VLAGKKRSDQVLIVDTIGHLSALYSIGKLAIIGGGSGKGIHNILEATGHGLPVVFGSNYQRFQEAMDLVSLRGAFSYNTPSEGAELIIDLLSDEEKYQKSSEICREYTVKNQGAVSRILLKVFSMEKA